MYEIIISVKFENLLPDEPMPSVDSAMLWFCPIDNWKTWKIVQQLSSPFRVQIHYEGDQRQRIHWTRDSGSSSSRASSSWRSVGCCTSGRSSHKDLKRNRLFNIWFQMIIGEKNRKGFVMKFPRVRCCQERLRRKCAEYQFSGDWVPLPEITKNVERCLRSEKMDPNSLRIIE